MCGIFHPSSQNDQYFFNNIDEALDIYCSFKKIVLVGDFNAQVGKRLLDTFLYQHDLHGINENPTCCKNSSNPSNIDPILTNCSQRFFKTNIVFTGRSEIHKLVLSVFKTTFAKSKPKEIKCRSYWKVNENYIKQDFHNQLCSDQPKDYASVENIFLSILEEHSPLKKKLLRANHAPYVTKALRKAIMRRSYLEKLYFKNRAPSFFKKYKKQENYCSKFYKKERKAHFDKLNPKMSLATKSLQTNENPHIIDEQSDITDPILKAIITNINITQAYC